MEYLNKFRSTMTSVAMTVSNALPGNPITREYDIGSQVASAGPGLLWTIFSAKKKSTQQEVSVWVFEKKTVERWPKTEKEMFCELLKRGVSQLTRLRHPRLLVVEHALEESRDSLAFCTEPVFSCLANCLGRIDNMPSLIPSHLSDFVLLDIEIRHGLFQLSEALAFLHMDAKMLHRYLCPAAVIISAKGQWKLAGFYFSTQGMSASNGQTSFEMVAWDANLMPCVQPSLNYLAPEYIIGAHCDMYSDIYSLGVLSYALFNKGRPIFDHENSVTTFKKNIEKLKGISPKMLEDIPPEFRDDLKMCLNLMPDLRPDATQFSRIRYFDDALVKTLNYFESLCQMDNSQKSQFFKGLPNMLTKFQKRPLLQKVLPFLCGEFSTADLIPFILPSVFLIAEQATNSEFFALVFPQLIPIFQIQRPYQIVLLLLQRMEMLLQKTPEEDIKTHVLPLIYNALDSDTTKIQELCLGLIPNIGRLVDRESMKNQLLPKLLRLAAEAPVLAVKVQALISTGKLLPTLESWMVVEQVLPALPKIHSKEPGVLMAILGIYKMVFETSRFSVTKEQCAKSILPYLMATSVENSLNLAQFEQFIVLIKVMFDKVEREQRNRLQQLSALQEEQRSVQDFSTLISQTESKKQLPKSLDALTHIDLTDTRQDYPLTSVVATKKPVGTPLSLEEKKCLAAEQESARLKQLPNSASSSSLGCSASANCTVMLQPVQTSMSKNPVPATTAPIIDLTAFLPTPPKPVNPIQKPSNNIFQPNMYSTPKPLLRPQKNVSASKEINADTVQRQMDLSAFDSLISFPPKETAAPRHNRTDHFAHHFQ